MFESNIETTTIFWNLYIKNNKTKAAVLTCIKKTRQIENNNQHYLLSYKYKQKKRKEKKRREKGRRKILP